MDLQAAVESCIDWVGREQFDAARALAWETAEGTGTGRRVVAVAPPEDIALVPHTLAEVVSPGADDPLPDADDAFRHEVLFALYPRMPSYPLIMRTPAVRSEEVLAVFAENVRDLLRDEDPRLADPVAYHLWCGEFERGPTVSGPLWRLLTTDIGDHPRLLRRLLDISGPVDWSVKRGLLRELHADPRWRDLVRQALEHARNDAFGSIDEADVLTWA